MAFVWTKELETGHSLIDNEHKQLVKAADELVEACAHGKGRQELTASVNFLSNYTKTHFSHEEELMVKSKYTDYSGHRAWHQTYIKDIEAVSEKLKTEGATIALVGEVNMKIGQLIVHIKSMDKKLAQFLQNS